LILTVSERRRQRAVAAVRRRLQRGQSDLPPIAAKADDLEEIKKAVDDAASVGGGLWLSYLFLLFYLAVAAGRVTHADLFVENPVKLPFLNIDLPLLAFFIVAPILFLVVHAYVFVHLVFLSDKAKRFDRALREQIGGIESERRQTIRTGLRRQLPSNIFVQFIAGPADLRKGGFGWLLRVIAWVTLVIAPVVLLLLIQIQFLPYHSARITWSHRIALLADLGLIWLLWRRILSGWKRRASFAWTGVGAVLTGCALLFSVAVVTFPGEGQEYSLAIPDKARVPVSLHDWVYRALVDDSTPGLKGFFSNTLVLSGSSIYESLGTDPDHVKWRDYTFIARGRDLKGAVFVFANLPNVDFTGADLEDASFMQALLQMASLDGANLQNANLIGANLRGASFFGAQLQGAFLQQAQLQGSFLFAARLQGAILDGANLQGAALDEVMLQGASLRRAQLQGASLTWANLEGASLDLADLRGASLFGAQLQGATLQEALLQATDLSDSLLWRTNSTPLKFLEPTATRLPAGTGPWGPLFWAASSNDRRRWNDDSYNKLRKTLDALLSSETRIEALKRINRLDCSNPDSTLTSCDPTRPPSGEAAAWQSLLEGSRVDDVAYSKALASVLRTEVCVGLGDRGGQYAGGRGKRVLDYAFVENAAFVLRGLMASTMLPPGSRLNETGPEAPALIDFIMSRDCPVSAALTDAEKARLLQIKRDAIEEAARHP
jgi:uncharacterized protein YjbI with pentapeptide repeats